MKILIKIGLGLIAIITIFAFQIKRDNKEYIRIHVIANSNEEIDRQTKLDIKDMVNLYLAESLNGAKSKDDGLKIIEKNINQITLKCNRALHERGLNYTAEIKLSNEYCPSRKYSNTTVESGYYDTLSITLGEGNGDNWWCVMYPPLCYKSQTNKLNFSSRIFGWLKCVFN